MNLPPFTLLRYQLSSADILSGCPLDVSILRDLVLLDYATSLCKCQMFKLIFIFRSLQT